MKQKFDVTGMSCSACQAHVEKAVKKLPGVQEAAVNLLANNMTVTYDETVLDDGKIVSAVTDAGYGASVHESSRNSGNSEKSPGSGRTRIPC